MSSTAVLFEILGAVWRQRLKAILTFALVLAATGAALVKAPRTYRSEAQIFVRLGRETVSLDPTATTGQTISVYESRESEVNSIREMLHSRVLLERTVDALGPQAILGAPETQSERHDSSYSLASLESLAARAKSNLSTMLGSEKLSPRDAAIRQLENAVDIWGGRKSSVLGVSIKSRSPLEAQRILEAFLQAYQEMHVQANRTPGTLAFFEEQTDLLKTRLEEATQNLQTAKDEYGLASIEGERRNLEGQISAIDESRLIAQREHSSAEASIASLRALAEQAPQRVISEETEGLASAAADAMRNRFFELEIRERELLSKFTEEHPDVIATREQLREAEKILAEQPTERQEQKTTLNPAYQEIQLALTREQVRAASAQAQIDALRLQRESLLHKLQELNAAEVRLTALERQVQLCEADYRKYALNCEQARIDQALEEQSISNINVIQPPSFEPKPVSPKRTILAGAGLLCALMSSVGVAWMSQRFARPRSAPIDEIYAVELEPQPEYTPLRPTVQVVSQGAANSFS